MRVYLNASEVARLLNVDRATVARWLQKGLIPRAIRVKGKQQRRDPYLRCFYQNLLARGKARLQAVVAVMRKLLHALFAMFRTNQPYDGSKLCCAVEMAGHAIAACA